MLIWTILAVLLALNLLFLSMKVGIRVLFGSETKAWVKIGPVMKQVYPVPEKKRQTEDQTKKREKNPPEKEKPKRNITFGAIWALIQELIPLVLDMMERTRKGICIRRIDLHLVISDRDPAEAARRYGKLNTVLWPLLSAIENTVTVADRKVSMDLDFAAVKSSAEGELFITMRVYHGVRIFFADGIGLLKAVLHFAKAIKPASANKETRKEKRQTAPVA